jgi:hypothetical protein
MLIEMLAHLVIIILTAKNQKNAQIVAVTPCIQNQG